MLQIELKVVGGKHNDQVVSLPIGKFLIGREQDCHLRPNSELVSRHHCVFTTDEYGVRVKDLGSTNGTLVNDERIAKSVTLVAGDKVAIGALNFEVVIKKASPVAAEAAVAGAAAAAAPEAVPAAPAPTTEPIAQPGEDTVAGDGDTVFDLPAQAPQPAAPDVPTTQTQTNMGDTTVVVPNPYPMPPQQQYPAPPMGYPPGYGQYPQPGMMYPPQYPPQMPYGQPPMPYPPQQQPMQTQAIPTMPQQPISEPEAPAEMPDVSLPDPKDTGVKDTPAKGSGGSAPAGSEENPSGSAGDIIKQYIQRRPG